jgi:hypothetical protein
MDAVGSPAKSRRGPAHNRKLNEKKVSELAELGVCPADIAKHQGVDHSAVWQFLERQGIERKQIEKYKAERADIFAGLQGKALAVQEKAMDYLLQDGVFASLEDKAKVSLINSLNNVFGTAYDKERLERGQSTQNVSLIGKMMGSALDSVHKAPETPSIEAEKLGSYPGSPTSGTDPG